MPSVKIMALSVKEGLAFTEHVLFTQDAEAEAKGSHLYRVGSPRKGSPRQGMPVFSFVLIIMWALLCHPTFND